MHRVLFGWRMTLALAAVWTSAVVLRAEGTLTEQIESVINQPMFRNAHWGILIVDRMTGETLIDLNSDKLFAPASTTKLFTVAAALDALGADYRFETPVYARGEIDPQGQLSGDLILVASGDLTMQGRTDSNGQIAFVDVDHTYANGSRNGKLTAPDPLAGLDQLAQQIKEAGVKRVTGDVIIDDRLFDKEESTGSGPLRVTPIMVNDNLIDVTVRPGSAGEPAKIEWRPQTVAFEVVPQVRTEPAGTACDVAFRFEKPNRLVISGGIAADQASLLRVFEVPNPAAFARTLLIEALGRAGVEVVAPVVGENAEGKLPAEKEYANLRRVALLTSPPFSEEAKLILKVSHNLHASTLPLLVAHTANKRTLNDGLRMERDFLLRAGVDAESISFGGGAGGSRADFTTPKATVALLRYMATRPDFEVYHRALPILGVDGTLVDAVDSDSPAHGRVQAKTGTFYWYNGLNDRHLLLSKALAGYLTAASGRELVFSFLVNNVHMQSPEERARVGRVLGRLCEITCATE